MSSKEANDKKGEGWGQIIAAIIGAIAVIAAALIGTKNCDSRKDLVLQIKQPASGTSVPATVKRNDDAAYFPVIGVLEGTPAQSNLAIYVMVYDGGAWWVQDSVPAKEGAWSLEAWVGGKENKPKTGQEFKLRMVLADKDTVESHKKTGLPVSEDARELNRVILSVNTPSVFLGAMTSK